MALADNIITEMAGSSRELSQRLLETYPIKTLKEVLDLMGVDATDFISKKNIIAEIIHQNYPPTESVTKFDPMIFDQGIEAESGHDGDQDSEPTAPDDVKPVTSRFTQARLEAVIWAKFYSTRLKTAQKDGEIWATANSECESAERKLVQLLMDAPDDGSRELLMEHILMNNADTFLRAYNGYEL